MTHDTPNASSPRQQPSRASNHRRMPLTHSHRLKRLRKTRTLPLSRNPSWPRQPTLEAQSTAQSNQVTTLERTVALAVIRHIGDGA
jgi:hypothetical protein